MHRQERDYTVRKAAQHDVLVVAEILGEAFRDDPILTWIMPNDEQRHREVPRYFLAVAQHLYLPHREVYLTDSVAGAALWLPPGVSADSIRALAMLPLLWRLYWTCGIAGLRRANRVAAVMRSNHPAHPHYYLHALGVRSEWQGRGIGSALIQYVTERCDREQCLAYLENTNERNLPLYERNGFRVVSEWHADGNGPPIWFMVRRPRESARQGVTHQGQ
jgi:ribosomal protein S18 acetylase RimI-like enzyme